MLHTFLHRKMETVQNAVEKPFKEYIRSSLNSHVKAAVDLNVRGAGEIGDSEKARMLDYAYQRYFKTAAIFGTVEDGKNIVDQAIEIGVNDVACVVDFGVDYSTVKDSLPYLRKLISDYL